MSYCRWSTDYFRCDLYCYEDIGGGYTTYVASNRHTLEIPKEWEQPVVADTLEERIIIEFGRQQMMHEMLEDCKRVPIGLPYDGEYFNDPDLESFLERVIMLRDEGYNVPEYVIDNIREELLEEKQPKGEK